MLSHPTLRLIGLALLLFGMINASVYPYQSLIAIDRIGLTEAEFALILVLASITAVTASVWFGILGDQRGNRRRIALVTCAASARHRPDADRPRPDGPDPVPRPADPGRQQHLRPAFRPCPPCQPLRPGRRATKSC